MINNKGFTMIEMLAMLVVLGVVMAVAIPNITGVLSNSKANMVAEDAKKMVNSAKTLFATSKLPVIENEKCILFTLNSLDTNDDFKEGPNGNPYDKYESFVVLKREANEYRYYFRLLEEVKSETYSGVESLTEEYNVFQQRYLDMVDESIKSTNIKRIKDKTITSDTDIQAYFNDPTNLENISKIVNCTVKMVKYD